MISERHKLTRRGLAVKRWHVVHTNRIQTVGEHTAAMMVILFEVTEPSVNLLRAVLEHDVLEAETGDMPAPVKWQNPELAQAMKLVEDRLSNKYWLGAHKRLTPEESWFLRYADIMELYMFVLEEKETGNNVLLSEIGRRVIDAVTTMLLDTPVGMVGATDNAHRLYSDVRRWHNKLAGVI